MPRVLGMEMWGPLPLLYENAQAARASDTVMPAEPISSSGRRPIRSTEIRKRGDSGIAKESSP